MASSLFRISPNVEEGSIHTTCLLHGPVARSFLHMWFRSRDLFGHARWSCGQITRGDCVVWIGLCGAILLRPRRISNFLLGCQCTGIPVRIPNVRGQQVTTVDNDDEHRQARPAKRRHQAHDDAQARASSMHHGPGDTICLLCGTNSPSPPSGPRTRALGLLIRESCRVSCLTRWRTTLLVPMQEMEQ